MGINDRSIVLPNSLKYIGNEAFSASRICSIKLPEGIIEINDRAVSDLGLKIRASIIIGFNNHERFLDNSIKKINYTRECCIYILWHGCR